MRKTQTGWFFLFLYLFVPAVHSVDADIARSIWAQQAIITTYHYDYKDYQQQQKQIARYFSAKAWIAYSKALHSGEIPQKVQQNKWTVRAVSMRPPKLKSLPEDHWQAEMPVLVRYSNSGKEQLQTLMVTLQFGKATADTGVDGFAIDSFQSKVLHKPCECALQQAKKNLP